MSVFSTEPLDRDGRTAFVPALSVVVPVFNEAGNIVSLVREIAGVLRPMLAFEIIVVDDASTDETQAALGEARRDTPELRVLLHATNAGQSAAVRSGVRAAGAGWVATLDGDGQNDPADLPAMLDAVSSDPDGPVLVAGCRVQRRDVLIKRLASRIANRVRGHLLRDDTPDSGCGLKLFERGVFLELPYFDHMHRFLPALVRRAGGTVAHIPVNHRPRSAGVSKYGTLDRLLVGITDLCGVMWLGRRHRQTAVTAVESPRETPPVALVKLAPLR